MGSDESEHEAPPPAFFGGLRSFGVQGPAHEVQLDAYCIDRYEVTVERYEACAQSGVCDPGGSECSYMPREGEYQTRVNHYPRECDNRGHLCPTFPVNCKSYTQAQSYCSWIGRRLCTEAEWERAASGPGPSKRAHPWGDAPPNADLLNALEHGPGHLMPVDSYPDGVSAEGVHNLAGNVYEWVADAYAPYRVGARPSRNPTGPRTGALRIGRGACFLSESGFKSADRTTFDPDFNWGCVGIRCCSTPEPAAAIGRAQP